ncbi:MAG: VCBS repeat-containing protein, partial [Planctomycetota bacterium]|nr:VCBS repeat-containing protein [Planctomycetota bacterium]
MSQAHLPLVFLVSASALALATLPTGEGSNPALPSPAVGGALSWTDFDGDGLRDVYVANEAGEDRLFRGLVNGRFEDATESAGLTGVTGTSAARWADSDGDGLPELFLASPGGARLLKNSGDGIFMPITERAGLGTQLSATDGLWLDYDRDGAVDLVVITPSGEVLYHNEGAGLFAEVTLEVPRTFTLADDTGQLGGPLADSGSGSPGTAGGPGGPGTIPPVDRSGGTQAPAAPPGGSSIPLPPPTPAPGSAWCPESIDDFSNPGVCLPASSVPMNGYLYPLGNEFFIDSATGNVGLGTTDPLMSVHINGDTALGNLMVAPSGGANNSSELWLAEDSDGSYRMGWRYDGGTNQLNLVATDDGGTTEMGPHMTVARNSGDTFIGGVLDVDDITPADGSLSLDGQLFARNVGDIGVFTPALWAENESTVNGTAIVAMSEGNDALSPTVYVVQSGTGPIIAGSGGSGIVFEVLASGRTVTTAVEITGGGDIVEGFEAREGEVEAGTVMSIDPSSPGQLMISTQAYDAKVAGVVSGAGGVNHGLRLGQDGVLDGETLVAMTGRVYVKCSAENGAISPGDLLTTADLAGHAMRASDGTRAFGAVIGKAMGPLDKGTGLVLVL